MNTLAKTITQSELSIEFLKSLNGLMNLSNRELELLSVFLDIQLEIQKRKLKVSIDSAQNRKLVMMMTGITKDNLSRYIKKYKNRGLIIKYDNILAINKVLVPIVIGNKSVQIAMVLKIKSNDNL